MKFALGLYLLASATHAFVPSVRTAASLRSANVPTTSLSAGVLNRVTGQSQLDPAVIQRYMDLPMPADTVLAEYVWVDADGACRSKTRTLPAAKVCFIDWHIQRDGLLATGMVSLDCDAHTRWYNGI
jgi:glutamine synthetase